MGVVLKSNGIDNSHVLRSSERATRFTGRTPFAGRLGVYLMRRVFDRSGSRLFRLLLRIVRTLVETHHFLAW